MKSRQQRLTFLVLASVGCLVLASAANGCSSDPDRDNGNVTTDAGTNDAGNRDGGTDAGTDAGVIEDNPNDHTIGARCTATQSGEQGNCDADLTCVTAGTIGAAGGLCTKPCTIDADCGSNGTSANICAPISETEAICVRGCDPLVVDSCNRASNACRALPNGKGVCDIRCTSTANGCPDGTSCNETSGLCEAGKYYDTCDGSIGNCEAGLACLFPQGGDPAGGICFQDCTAAANSCPARSTCSINAGSNKFCGKTCGGVTDPPCPGNSTCTQVAANTRVCLFKPPAGTRESYQSCDGSNACVEGATCLVHAQGDTAGHCFVDCTATGSTCPTGTACTQAGSSKFCFSSCAGGAACAGTTTCSQNLCVP